MNTGEVKPILDNSLNNIGNSREVLINDQVGVGFVEPTSFDNERKESKIMRSVEKYSQDAYSVQQDADDMLANKLKGSIEPTDTTKTAKS